MMLQIKWDYCSNLKILPKNPTLVSDEMSTNVTILGKRAVKQLLYNNYLGKELLAIITS